MNKFWRYIWGILVLAAALVSLGLTNPADDKLHVVFCDVGQGDAILAYRGTTQILVDGGPDSSVLSCLSRHLPFWDRKIELVVMTHPQEDHMAGLVDVLRRFEVGTFAAPLVDSSTATFAVLKKEVADKKIKVINPVAGTKIRVGVIQLYTFWPPKEAGQALGDLNEFSLVQRLWFGEFDVLLTGDIQPPVIDLVAEKLALTPPLAGEWEVLKVPHHGSKNGLTARFLAATTPDLAVISVGKDNRYGHPHQEVIEILRARDIRILRTDLDGEIEIISDGKSWWIR